jgi:class 3 adenylate cyclase
MLRTKEVQRTFLRPCSAPRPPARGLTASAPPPAARPNDRVALAGPARAAGGRRGAQGFATIGAIGFEGRLDYGAIGTVTNLAARLCGEAKPGQILGAVQALAEAEPVGELPLKGFSKPVRAFNIVGLKAPQTGDAAGR